MSSKFRGGNSEGDWICVDPECANLNFARRTACNRCGKEKIEASSKKKQIGVEIGKTAAEKSRGLFSADDWQCTKCGNVNWARRSSCNMCNAPKFGEIEERTGYGGGYNDRGVVEYIEREESDDEYDEFGRKKKKFRKATSDDEEDSPSKTDTASSDKESKKPDSRLKDTQKETKKEKEKEKEKDEEEEEEEEEEDEEDDDDEDADLSKYDLWGDDDDDDDKKKDKDGDDEDESKNKKQHLPEKDSKKEPSKSSREK